MANNDIHIAGSGTVSAGEYGSVRVSGSGSIQGSVTCETLHVSGSCRAEGDVTVADKAHISGGFSAAGSARAVVLHVSGSANVKGGVEARELHVSGGCSIGGDLQADEGRFSGSLRVDGMSRGGKLQSSGIFRAGKGVECEELRASGSFTAMGLVNAGSIEIEPDGECRADEIGCETIVVRRPRNNLGGLLRLFSTLRRQTLEANLIEGTDISLENTICPVVRGQRVAIGEGCRIGRVEYSERITVDPAAEVGEQVWTGEH